MVFQASDPVSSLLLIVLNIAFPFFPELIQCRQLHLAFILWSSYLLLPLVPSVLVPPARYTNYPSFGSEDTYLKLSINIVTRKKGTAKLFTIQYTARSLILPYVRGALMC